jgi:Uma2 family endonuclease
VRAADAAIWRARPPLEGFARTVPILAVEVTGVDESADTLKEKTEWYLAHGVEVIWIVLPQTRRVHVVTSKGTLEIADAARIPEHPSLPGLSPCVADFFQQL